VRGAASRRAPILVLAAALLAGCSGDVIVIGDSNSCFGRWPCGPRNWPALVQHRLEDGPGSWRVENRSQPGMTAGRFRTRDGKDAMSGPGEPAYAGFHLERAIRERDLAGWCRRFFHWPRPKLVLAVGTNDVGWQTVAPAAVADGILALKTRAEEVAPCVQVYVGLVPPRFAGDLARPQDIADVNAALRARLPARRVIDFFTGFTRTDFESDGVHMTTDAFRKRAEIAFPVLFPWRALLSGSRWP
jgi:lysophospholipase L1-like esterase